MKRNKGERECNCTEFEEGLTSSGESKCVKRKVEKTEEGFAAPLKNEYKTQKKKGRIGKEHMRGRA